MNTLYTVDINAEEPIMLINKHIGYDSVDGYGIMGDMFQKELMFLDTLGKKSIKVYINSVGGSVMDGMSIYNAILTTTTKVDTYCVGVAASIAAVIFQAGRKHVMCDYGVLMFHNPFNPDAVGVSDGADIEAFTNSIATMISSRSGKEMDAVREMMNATTWLNAEEATTSGLCDIVEASAEYNKPRMVRQTVMQDKWKMANTILNKILKPINMTIVASKLGLAETATEADMVTAIEALQTAPAANAADTAIAEMQNKITALELEKSEAATKLAAIEDSIKAKEIVALTTKATDMVNSFKAKLGGDNADVLASWVNKAVADYDGTEKLIKAIPVNVPAAKIDGADNNAKDAIPYSFATMMALNSNKK
jgi:ATP-dependent Clp protease protease subunit